MKRTSIVDKVLLAALLAPVTGCQSILGIDDVNAWDGSAAPVADSGPHEASAPDASADARGKDAVSSEGAAPDGGSPDGSDDGGQCPPGSTNCAAGCHAGDTRSCGHSAVGICHPGTETCGTNGTWSNCTGSQEPKPRDCTSSLDNDCNGMPDNTADAECQCTMNGATQPCGTHPGLDGKGICKAGSQTCNNGVWSTCLGSAAPAARDCTSPSDNDCDGKPDNTIDAVCQCNTSGSQPCQTHPGLDGKGICKAGTQSCTNGILSQCMGSVGPAPRDCSSPNDNNCDGSPDNTVDGQCQCSAPNGTALPCGTHPGLDGKGICKAGTQTCNNGVLSTCTGSVGPAARDCTSPLDNDCDGTVDKPSNACCIDAMVVSSGTVNPTNICAGCNPAVSATTWSARSSCANGDLGCSCTGSGPTEANCADGKDNDGDRAADCFDSDCNGKVCTDAKASPSYPSEDKEYDGIVNGNPLYNTSGIEIHVVNAPTPDGNTAGYFTFGNLPISTTAFISKVTFRFYYRTDSTTNKATHIGVFDVATGGSTAFCQTTLPIVSSMTAFDCDATTVVKNWFSSNVMPFNRTFRMGVFGDSGFAAIYVGATEGAMIYEPALLVDYQTLCSGTTCGHF
jgi:hypothetical protein